MRKEITSSEWSRTCPNCNTTIYYSNMYKMNAADKAYALCTKCKYKKTSASLTGKCLSDSHKQSLKNGWIRRKEKGYSHPMLGKHHNNDTKYKMSLAKTIYNPWIGKKHSKETKLKMSEKWKENPRNMEKVLAASVKSNRGKKNTPEHNFKISLSNMGRKCSDFTKSLISNRLKGIVRSEETKERLRAAKLDQLQKQGVSRTFNQNACIFMDSIGKKYGFNFRHANNGGEIMISGYMVDGYDSLNNIVFEYDEPKHENFNRKMMDLKRAERIIKKSNSKILRYSERYKKLYWSYPNMSKIFENI